MGFFPNFEGSGPQQDQPRKKGIFRFFETLTRDFTDIFRAGFLALLGCVPFAAGIAYSVITHTMLAAPVLGLVGGALAGPELCGLADTILRGFRDEPGFWWHTYKKAWVRSAKASLLPGGAGGFLLGTQLYLLANAASLGLDLITGAGLVAGVLLVLGLSLYLWPQLALMELSFPQLLKNSALLFLGQLPRSLAALAILTVYLWAAVQFFLLTMPLLPFTNLWLPVLPALFLIYPGINENFQIEDKLNGK